MTLLVLTWSLFALASGRAGEQRMAISGLSFGFVQGGVVISNYNQRRCDGSIQLLPTKILPGSAEVHSAVFGPVVTTKGNGWS
jgi:hypothetical protein